MVIEKFLAASMIALDLTAGSRHEIPLQNSLQPDGPRDPYQRPMRRRVRWLRQHLPPRPKRAPESQAPKSNRQGDKPKPSTGGGVSSIQEDGSVRTYVQKPQS